MWPKIKNFLLKKKWPILTVSSLLVVMGLYQNCQKIGVDEELAGKLEEAIGQLEDQNMEPVHLKIAEIMQSPAKGLDDQQGDQANTILQITIVSDRQIRHVEGETLCRVKEQLTDKEAGKLSLKFSGKFQENRPRKFETGKFPLKLGVAYITECHLLPYEEAFIPPGKAFTYKLTLPYSNPTLAISKIFASPVSSGNSQEGPLATNKISVGFGVVNLGPTQTFNMEVICLVKNKIKPGASNETETVYWKDTLVNTSAFPFTESVIFQYPLPASEIELAPGDYQVRCKFLSPSSTYLKTTATYYHDFKISFQVPTLEITRIAENILPDGGQTLSVEITNWGQGQDPILVGVGCKVKSQKKIAEVLWEGILSQSVVFPNGKPKALQFSDDHGKMNLESNQSYTAECEIRDGDSFDVKTEGPVIHELTVQKKLGI